MPSIFINILTAAAAGACIGLFYYGLTKIPLIQRQFQKFPKWVSFIAVLAAVLILYPMVTRFSNLRNIKNSSYDHNSQQQCLVLKEFYPDILTVEQLEKVRSYTNAEDPEMLRSYLMELANAKETELEKQTMRIGKISDRVLLEQYFHWRSITKFYKEWYRPSPEGRIKYARKMGEPITWPSGEKEELEYNVLVEGVDASRLVIRFKRPDLPNVQFRDSVTTWITSGKRWKDDVGAVGFTEYRFESFEGKGFTVKMTPRGGLLPLVKDDF